MFGVRGSAAGSVALYCLGITNVDPLEYRLVFERFLNLERKEMPDIDLDFQDDRRDEVLHYVVDRYGSDRVAQIITFGTLGAKAALRDVGRALGMPYGDVDRIARMVPLKSRTLADALKASGELGSEQLVCSVETGKALVEAGLHPATGGDGTQACSGDMLLQALVACAGVTLAAVATALEIDLKGGRVHAEGDLDFRGTLGADE